MTFSFGRANHDNLLNFTPPLSHGKNPRSTHNRQGEISLNTREYLLLAITIKTKVCRVIAKKNELISNDHIQVYKIQHGLRSGVSIFSP